MTFLALAILLAGIAVGCFYRSRYGPPPPPNPPVATAPLEPVPFHVGYPDAFRDAVESRYGIRPISDSELAAYEAGRAASKAHRDDRIPPPPVRPYAGNPAARPAPPPRVGDLPAGVPWPTTVVHLPATSHTTRDVGADDYDQAALDLFARFHIQPD